jgi:hypothetical protein
MSPVSTKTLYNNMTETAPLYFVEFEKRLNKRLDTIDEQLAEVTETVTVLEVDMKEVKQELKAAARRADRHSEEILIGLRKLDNHETRIDTLEKQIA